VLNTRSNEASGNGSFSGRLSELDVVVRSRAQRVPHHLARRVDADEPCAGEASSRRFEQLTRPASDIENCAWTSNLLCGDLQDRSLDRVEDDPLHPVSVIGGRPAVEAVDVVTMSHRFRSKHNYAVATTRLATDEVDHQDIKHAVSR